MHIPTLSPRWRAWLSSDGWAWLVLLAVGGRLALVAFAAVDLNFGDDAHYLEWGLALHPPSLPVGSAWAVWGPLYQLWFWALAQKQPDPVVVYYATVLLLGVTLPLLLYSVLRRLRVPWGLALGVAWFYGLSYANWLVEPRVAVFAAWVMLLGWLGVLHLPTPALRWGGLAAVAVLVAYVRPEFLLSAVLFALAAGIAAVRTPRPRPKVPWGAWVAWGGLTLVALTLLVWWTPPFQQGRTMYAFGQHYYYNLKFCLKAPLDPAWHWEDVLARDFDGATSLLDAAVQHPAAFGRHVACNLRALPLRLGQMFLYHLPWDPRGRRWPEAALLGLGLALVAAVRLRHPEGRRRLRQAGREEALWAAVLWALPVLLSSIFIQPRWHYLAQLVPLFWIGYAELFLVAWPTPSRVGQYRWAWLAAALLVGLTPPFSHFFHSPPQRPRLEAVAVGRLLTGDQPLRIAGTQGSGFYRLGAYLYPPRPYEGIALRPHGMPLAQALTTRPPDLFLVSQGGRELRNDPTWPEVEAHPERWGYLRIELPSGDAWGPWLVFVRASLWPVAAAQAGP